MPHRRGPKHGAVGPGRHHTPRKNQPPRPAVRHRQNPGLGRSEGDGQARYGDTGREDE